MKFAPVGVGAAIAVTVSHSGPGVLRNLGLLVATLYGALIVFALVGFLPVALLSRVPLRRFVRAVKDPAVIAFTTTSSDAALPVAMERMIELGVPRSIVAFVVPTGYSFNLDGSTLYLGVASVFVAQAAGIHQSLGTQLAMMLTLLVASKGVAGVPRGSLVVLSGVLSGYGLPAEGVAVLLGVDELMDMARTTVNVVGNCLATVVIGRWEGELELSQEARGRCCGANRRPRSSLSGNFGEMTENSTRNFPAPTAVIGAGSFLRTPDDVPPNFSRCSGLCSFSRRRGRRQQPSRRAPRSPTCATSSPSIPPPRRIASSRWRHRST